MYPHWSTLLSIMVNLFIKDIKLIRMIRHSEHSAAVSQAKIVASELMEKHSPPSSAFLECVFQHLASSLLAIYSTYSFGFYRHWLDVLLMVLSQARDRRN